MVGWNKSSVSPAPLLLMIYSKITALRLHGCNASIWILAARYGLATLQIANAVQYFSRSLKRLNVEYRKRILWQYMLYCISLLIKPKDKQSDWEREGWAPVVLLLSRAHISGHQTQGINPGFPPEPKISGLQTPGFTRGSPPPPPYITKAGGEPWFKPGDWCPEIWAHHLYKRGSWTPGYTRGLARFGLRCVFMIVSAHRNLIE
jgi:hypothetical protein